MWGTLMCGFSGFLEATTQARDSIKHVAVCMTKTLVHLGPDHGDVWVDSEAGIAIGHSRLAILDLPPQGHQPMISNSGRYVIAFNGEIYNHRKLRKELEKENAAPAWKGHSDTEVMLAAFDMWGVEDSLPRLNGMFAFGLWDQQEHILHLSRDRFGEKPLYYGWMGDAFLFGSELKALKAHPAWRGEVDRGALALFMRHNYIPAPYSIYHGGADGGNCLSLVRIGRLERLWRRVFVTHLLEMT